MNEALNKEDISYEFYLRKFNPAVSRTCGTGEATILSIYQFFCIHSFINENSGS